MRRIAPAWLEAAPTRALLAALDPARPLFVGGCVRDALLGREAQDVDLCVAVPPEETTRLLEGAGLGAAPTGIAHGTVTAIVEGRGYEVTTLRRDVETFGRRARVAFTDCVREDASRRDFTINALYADAEGCVIDPLDGAPDLEAGRVRFIGDPSARIGEDHLRILRFFRFIAWFSRTGVDAEGLAACAALADRLGALARERIGHELRRLLAAPDPSEAVAAMAGAGALDAAIPGARPHLLAALIRAEAACAAAPDWPRRLAALGATDPEDAMRLSRAEARRLRAIAEARALDAAPEARAHLVAPEAARDAALLDAAEGGAPPPADLEARLAAGAAARFPLEARDLIAAGVAPGPDLGASLDRLRRLWAQEGFAPDRAALLARL
ncbi:CCA tRNA nucleotidyltransferase [Rubrimonas sp.]|uniref:CCA tRNA nucleotidyltransferase n=1 Tax=Rubrimonas sp. TaxID=2036015 RepID=UPI002FDE8050